jgi:hypothetical protein
VVSCLALLLSGLGATKVPLIDELAMDAVEVGIQVLLDLVSLLVELLLGLLFRGFHLDDLGEQLVLMEVKLRCLRFGREVSLDQVLSVLDQLLLSLFFLPQLVIDRLYREIDLVHAVFHDEISRDEECCNH